MDEKHKENMFFAFTTIHDPLGPPHVPPPQGTAFRFFQDFFFSDLAYGLSHVSYGLEDVAPDRAPFFGRYSSKID